MPQQHSHIQTHTMVTRCNINNKTNQQYKQHIYIHVAYNQHQTPNSNILRVNTNKHTHNHIMSYKANTNKHIKTKHAKHGLMKTQQQQHICAYIHTITTILKSYICITYIGNNNNNNTHTFQQ